MAAFWEEIKKGRIGLIVGSILGFIAGKFFISVQDLQSLFVTQSIFDSAVGSVGVVTKSAWFFALIGGIVGYFVQINFDKIRGMFR